MLKVNYNNYSSEELYIAWQSLNAEKYPEREQELLSLLNSKAHKEKFKLLQKHSEQIEHFEDERREDKVSNLFLIIFITPIYIVGYKFIFNDLPDWSNPFHFISLVLISVIFWFIYDFFREKSD